MKEDGGNVDTAWLASIEEVTMKQEEMDRTFRFGVLPVTYCLIYTRK